MSEDIHKENLKKAIHQLPEFEPREGLWNRVAEELDFEQKVKPLIASLPEHEPTISFDQITERLDDGKKIYRLGFMKYAAAIAASLFIAYFSWNQFRKGIAAPEKIEYSQETVLPTDTLNNTDKYEQKAMEYIEESCNSQPAKCAMKDINVLKTELQYLYNQNQLLQEEGVKYGNDANMVKDQIKLENMKSKVIKELIQKLNS
jgi:hypothetical protein